MAIVYTKAKVSGNSTVTDLVSSSGKDWDHQEWLGHGIFSTGRSPCFSNYRGDVYIIGCYSRVLYRPRQDRRFLPAGIIPSRKKLVVTEAGGGGGSEGRALAFVTLLHKEGPLVLAESDRSNVVDIGVVSGGGFQWSGFPTENEEFRVTHIRGYRSMDGDDYRMAWESPYGIETFTENVLTEHRTIIGPAWKRNGIPPKGLHFGTDWSGRMFYARTSEHPYRLWWSAAGDPQYVHETAYVDTWDRSAITCIAKARNELLVFTLRNAYLVRQFGQEASSDFVLVKLDSNVGCISHFGAVEIHNRLWFPGEDGIWIYDGGFHYLMRDMRPYWVEDYQANKDVFRGGHAFDDRKQKTYVFSTGRSPAQTFEGFLLGTVAYVGTYEMYEPSIAGMNARPQPDWTIDAYGRRNSSAYYNADGEVLIGSCDGQIRKFDDTDPDDDSDSVLKAMVIRHGLNVLNEPGDDKESGKHIDDFWAYVESELGPWTMYLMGGDEGVVDSVRPDNVWQWWKADVAASAKVYAQTIGSVTKTLKANPKTVHYFGAPSRVTGRGYVLEIQATSPVGVKYRGHGGSFSPGSAVRAFEDETDFDLTLEWRKQGAGSWETGPVNLIDAYTDPPASSITIEFRSTCVYSYGAASFPIDLDFDFSGANMPADAVDAIPSGTQKTTAVVFDMTGDYADGSLVLTATDQNGITDSVTIAVLVAVSYVKPQYQVDGGGWNDFSGILAIGPANVLETRANVAGNYWPVEIQEQFNYVHKAGSPTTAAAAGNYFSAVIPYPGTGNYLDIAQTRIPGGNIITNTAEQVNWS